MLYELPVTVRSNGSFLFVQAAWLQPGNRCVKQRIKASSWRSCFLTKNARIFFRGLFHDPPHLRLGKVEIEQNLLGGLKQFLLIFSNQFLGSYCDICQPYFSTGKTNPQSYS